MFLDLEYTEYKCVTYSSFYVRYLHLLQDPLVWTATKST